MSDHPSFTTSSPSNHKGWPVLVEDNLALSFIERIEQWIVHTDSCF
jgi:hypothetical protein